MKDRLDYEAGQCGYSTIKGEECEVTQGGDILLTWIHNGLNLDLMKDAPLWQLLLLGFIAVLLIAGLIRGVILFHKVFWERLATYLPFISEEQIIIHKDRLETQQGLKEMDKRKKAAKKWASKQARLAKAKRN